MSNQKGASGDPAKGRLGAVFLTILIDLIGFSIIFPLFPAMLDYYLPRDGPESLLGTLVFRLGELSQGSGADPQFLTHVLFGGILGSLFSILQFLFSPIWGGLSDRYGRRSILLFTIAGTTFSYILWIFSGSFWLLLVARTIGGIMSGNLSVATAAVADLTSREKRSGAMALVGVAFGLGFILGPAIGGFSALLDPIQYNPKLASIGINPFSVPAFFAALLSALNLIWVWRRFPRPAELNTSEEDFAFSKRERMRSIFTSVDPRIRRTNHVYFLFILSFSGMEFTLTFLAFERLRYGPHDNALMFLFIGIVLILVQGIFVRRMVPVTGEKALVMAGMVAGIFGFALLASADGWPAFFTALSLVATGVALASPSLTSLVSLYSQPQNQGRNLGGFRAAGSLARAIGPLLAGLLYWSCGSHLSYILGSLTLCAPLILALSLPKPSANVED